MYSGGSSRIGGKENLNRGIKNSTKNRFQRRFRNEKGEKVNGR